MAEIDSSGGGKKKGPKKVSTKVDMTPMVDLAFLLITFFMLTTTFAKPQTMEVNMPDKTQKKDETSDIKESLAMVIIMAEDNRLFYYTGIKAPEVREAVYGGASGGALPGIRSVITKKLKETSDKAFFVIKAKDKSTYLNLVDVLDEMAITNAPSYAIADITPEDVELVDKAKAAAPAPK
ncbi:MAG: biopolymer transporter ExbD [Bacteroidota bacterium]